MTTTIITESVRIGRTEYHVSICQEKFESTYKVQLTSKHQYDDWSKLEDARTYSNFKNASRRFNTLVKRLREEQGYYL